MSQTLIIFKSAALKQLAILFLCFRKFFVSENSLTHVKEKSKKLYYNNLFETNKANAKKVWKGINDLLRRRKNKTFSLTKIIATDGRIITDGNENL